MADDSDLVRESETGAASPLRTVKGLARLLYRMGRTFDNLTTSQLNTEEFLRTGNPAVLMSRSDEALLNDLKDASAFVLETGPDTPLDFDWAYAINAHLTKTAAMKPGRLRVDGEPVWVDTVYGRYTPGTPDPDELADIMGQAETSTTNVFAASRLFVRLARLQPFGDGNKRTAMLAAKRPARQTRQPIYARRPRGGSRRGCVHPRLKRLVHVRRRGRHRLTSSPA